jgi:hypothetical protein
MTDEEANSFAVSINEYKIKIRDHHRAIVANKSKGNCHTKDEHEAMILILETRIDDYREFLHNLHTAKNTPAKKPFIEKYLVPLLFAFFSLTIAIICIWRH